MTQSLITQYLISIAVGGVIGIPVGIGLTLAWHRWTVRRPVDEMHEHIAADERIIAKAYYGPSYDFRLSGEHE